LRSTMKSTHTLRQIIYSSKAKSRMTVASISAIMEEVGSITRARFCCQSILVHQALAHSSFLSSFPYRRTSVRTRQRQTRHHRRAHL
jgi:hypothetical protein